VVFLLAFLACGPNLNPCELYAEAYQKCLLDAGVDNAAVDADGMCGGYEPSTHADAYQQCLADAYDRDCAADGGLDAASEAAAECNSMF
jgi:hypothetical protein